ncbi:MAG: HPP family protein [bacterium]
MKLPARKSIADVSAAYRSTPIYVVIASTLTMAVVGALAVWRAEPFVFPPIGATLFILFAFPLAQEANPRNVIGGHLIGLATGIAALLIFGLVNVPPDTTDLDWHRLGAILVGLALAISVLMGLRVLHIPAVATTLVVAMGLLSRPEDWAVMLVGVLVATALAVGINRLVGIPHPFWHDPSAERATGRD